MRAHFSDVSLPATPKHTKINKKHVKHVAVRELPSSVPDPEPIDTMATQPGAVPADMDACKRESVNDTTIDQITITNEIDETSPRHTNSIELENAKDVESREAKNEAQMSSNSTEVVIESPPSDDNYHRNESPPSLELETEKDSDNDCDMNEVNDEFDDFQRNSNELSGDTTSLPSLNFESIRNSPDIKSDEIDEKKSEPDDVNEDTIQPMYPDEQVVTTSSQLFDGEPPPLDTTLESLGSISFQPIEIAGVNPAVVSIGDDFPSENFAFDADFRQFSAFERENATQLTEKPPYLESKALDADFDDDFGDFEEAPSKLQAPEVGNTLQDAATDFDDDDFGDFNDFQPDTASVSAPVHTPLADIPKTTSFDLKSISERFKSILETAFPTNGDDDEDTSNEMGFTSKIDHLINGTTMHLKSFENAKALEHQWTNSTAKSVLIKALGIDGRNIVSAQTIIKGVSVRIKFCMSFQMYGENWKSPLPRFAANLGYIALEPLKPVAVDNSSVNNNNSRSVAPSKSNECLNASSTEPAIRAERPPDVPAVQFDWNSAGLVNPLDGMNSKKLFEQSFFTHWFLLFIPYRTV